MGEMIKAPGLRPRAFISFLVFGNPDEILALVFEILLLVSKEAVVLLRSESETKIWCYQTS